MPKYKKPKYQQWGIKLFLVMFVLIFLIFTIPLFPVWELHIVISGGQIGNMFVKIGYEDTYSHFFGFAQEKEEGLYSLNVSIIDKNNKVYYSNVAIIKNAGDHVFKWRNAMAGNYIAKVYFKEENNLKDSKVFEFTYL